MAQGVRSGSIQVEIGVEWVEVCCEEEVSGLLNRGTVDDDSQSPVVGTQRFTLPIQDQEDDKLK